MNSIRSCLAAAVLALGLQTAAYAETSPPQAAPTLAHAADFTVDMSVRRLLANPQAKAVLDRYLPGLATNPHYFVIQFWSLRQVAASSNGRLTDAHLVQIGAALARIG